MKKILIALMFIATNAYAEKWLVAQNDAGGQIVLTLSNCKSNNENSGKIVIAYHSNGKSITGCWWYFSNLVNVVYDDGTTYTYPPSIFTLKEN